ncbi:uncharacterized protein CANTADRAFT_92354 [Suhomyces tanzawaensis NRRL Y-17324]|uniref:Uncharacterized protein n=1 Tax=Suhomyces tanzawaensis NRRL Y-17324 TaxID=984487 RepID=A0A1E4SB64_9ASCO|nr:uncharacterized protein CANTADRAFT_92354 [Suhomyces tanzawaensis NRRL Y-17324]ODV76767.1 hypothetical protein CANTADRAFT_92354 [Suhomyces tanzawaensis NRRL Y-17324]
MAAAPARLRRASDGAPMRVSENFSGRQWLDRANFNGGVASTPTEHTTPGPLIPPWMQRLAREPGRGFAICYFLSECQWRDVIAERAHLGVSSEHS